GKARQGKARVVSCSELCDKPKISQLIRLDKNFYGFDLILLYLRLTFWFLLHINKYRLLDHIS
ncbi:MAG: hypothetical protein NTX25_24090, partial [Proteobacteria bacterium]|nr:hypothetical protein [Pseudomonadota bacterium]